MITVPAGGFPRIESLEPLAFTLSTDLADAVGGVPLQHLSRGDSGDHYRRSVYLPTLCCAAFASSGDVLQWQRPRLKQPARQSDHWPVRGVGVDVTNAKPPGWLDLPVGGESNRVVHFQRRMGCRRFCAAEFESVRAGFFVRRQRLCTRAGLPDVRAMVFTTLQVVSRRSMLRTGDRFQSLLRVSCRGIVRHGHAVRRDQDELLVVCGVCLCPGNHAHFHILCIALEERGPRAVRLRCDEFGPCAAQLCQPYFSAKIASLCSLG